MGAGGCPCDSDHPDLEEVMNLRIKTHSMPGDVTQQQKEAMLEGREDRPRHASASAAKTFKKVIRTKERAVLKERTKQRIKQDLEK